MSGKPKREHLNSVGVVCRRTGLKSDRLRAWERRYKVVEPLRSKGNQRLYTQADVEKLSLLRRVTESGYRIAQVASLPVDELRELVDIDITGHVVPSRRPRPGDAEQARVFVGASLNAIQQLDADGLRVELNRALEVLSPAALTEQLLVPLIEEIGNLWAEGGLKASHEHLGTAVLRTFIEGLRVARRIPPDAPGFLVATPVSERHELGAMLATATATDAGWCVTYVGPDLPAVEIAGAARQRGVRAVGLSIVRPGDPELVHEELLTLRRHLGAAIGLIVGGRGAANFESTAVEIGAVVVEDLVGLAPALSRFA